MSKFAIIIMLMSVLKNFIAADDFSDWLRTVHDLDKAANSVEEVRGLVRKTLRELPSMAVEAYFCPSSTFADCNSLVEKLETADSTRDICCGYNKLIKCYQTLKVEEVCQRTLDSKADMLETTARDICEEQDILLVDACDLPTGYLIIIEVMLTLIVFTGVFFLFAFRYQIKKFFKC